MGTESRFRLTLTFSKSIIGDIVTGPDNYCYIQKRLETELHIHPTKGCFIGVSRPVPFYQRLLPAKQPLVGWEARDYR